MGDDHQGPASETRHCVAAQLFLVRVWGEQRDPHTVEWCGRVQHILRGEAHSFVGWETLTEYLQGMMAPADSAAGEDTLEAAEPP